MSEDWSRRHENGCAGPNLSGEFEKKGPEARKSENPKIHKCISEPDCAGLDLLSAFKQYLPVLGETRPKRSGSWAFAGLRRSGLYLSGRAMIWG